MKLDAPLPIQPVAEPIVCSPYVEPEKHWVYDLGTGVPLVGEDVLSMEQKAAPRKFLVNTTPAGSTKYDTRGATKLERAGRWVFVDRPTYLCWNSASASVPAHFPQVHPWHRSGHEPVRFRSQGTNTPHRVLPSRLRVFA